MLEYRLGDLTDIALEDCLVGAFSVSSISMLFFSISSAAMRPVFFFCFMRFGISKMRAVTTMRASRPATPPTAMMATTLVERPPIVPGGPDISIDGC